jgi:NAD(P)-dependent dehydrogenase (short-subunit alcohol dehydrogenase family)
MVEALAEAGAVTVTAARGLAALQTLAGSLTARGLRVVARELDQGSEESILRLRDSVLQEFGRVDVLVNNAVLRCLKQEINREQWEQSLRVNATGLYLMTEHFAEAMIKSRRGSIINVASIQGMIGPDLSLYEGLSGVWHVPDYYFHKGGMLNFTRYMASVLGRHGVRVNAISPGGFFNHQPEAFVRRYNDRTFLGRMANETDMKGVVVFLASDASAYITGANIPVDAGYTAK